MWRNLGSVFFLCCFIVGHREGSGRPRSYEGYWPHGRATFLINGHSIRSHFKCV